MVLINLFAEQEYKFMENRHWLHRGKSLSHVQLSVTPSTARPPCPSPTPGACSNSCPSRISDAIQPSHLLSSPSPAFNLSQHQSLS